VERLLEEVRWELSGLPFYVGVEEGYVYVKRTAPMDQRQFRKYTEVCRRLGFDTRGERWVKPLEELHLQRYKPASNPTQTPQAGHPSWTGWRRR
jgi:lipocalin